MQQNKDLELFSDSTGSENALATQAFPRKAHFASLEENTIK
jgi:hypothetical protein